VDCVRSCWSLSASATMCRFRSTKYRADTSEDQNGCPAAAIRRKRDRASVAAGSDATIFLPNPHLGSNRRTLLVESGSLLIRNHNGQGVGELFSVNRIKHGAIERAPPQALIIPSRSRPRTRRGCGQWYILCSGKGHESPSQIAVTLPDSVILVLLLGHAQEFLTCLCMRSKPSPWWLSTDCGSLSAKR
jgi:hypothetical protein